MESKGNNTPAAVSKFEDRLSAMGCVICGGEARPHHVIGKQQPVKVNGVTEKLGMYFCVPFCHLHHTAWHKDRKSFIELHIPEFVGAPRFDAEIYMFNLKVARLLHMLPDGFNDAIQAYHR